MCWKRDTNPEKTESFTEGGDGECECPIRGRDVLSGGKEGRRRRRTSPHRPATVLRLYYDNGTTDPGVTPQVRGLLLTLEYSKVNISAYRFKDCLFRESVNVPYQHFDLIDPFFYSARLWGHGSRSVFNLIAGLKGRHGDESPCSHSVCILRSIETDPSSPR